MANSNLSSPAASGAPAGVPSATCGSELPHGGLTRASAADYKPCNAGCCDTRSEAKGVATTGALRDGVVSTPTGAPEATVSRTPNLPAGINLAVNLGGLAMKNPVTTASGTFAAGREYNDFVDVAALGAVTTKGVSLNGWEGNASPRIAETPSGMLNSIGLQNPGVAHLKADELPWLKQVGATTIVNVSGHSVAEYVSVIEALEDAPVDAYEVNISCPNVDAGGMTIGCHAPSAAAVVAACRAATKRPLIVKLTPNVTDVTEIAKAAVDAGADAISLINTLLGMAINARTRRPELARVVGGLSGPAVKPVALRMVWQVHNAVDVPILGMGGITNGTDAIEFMLAGATAVAVGTANFMNPHATIDVLEGMAAYCKEQGVTDINDLIGALQV